MKLYLVMQVAPWRSLKVLGTIPAEPPTEGSYGFCQVFESLEAAEREYPDATIVTVETGES